MRLLPLLLLFPWPARAGLLIGEPVEHALAVHLSAAGLDHLGDAVEAMVPPTIPISGVGGELWCAEDDALPLTYAMDDLEIRISADDVVITTAGGRLDLTLYGTLSSSESAFYASGDCSVLTGLDEVCRLQIPTTALSAHLGLTIVEVEGGFDAAVDDLSVSISPVTNPLDDCTLASAVGTMLGQDEAAIANLLLSYLEPALADLAPTLEAAVEDGLNALVLETTLDLGAVPLGLSLFPTRLDLSEEGLVLGMGARLEADGTADCVDAGAGSEFAGDDWPLLDGRAPGTTLEYDAAVVLGRDFVDHLLYALWATGMLCIDLQDLGGAPLTTDLLEGFLGEGIGELFPEPAAATLRVQPEGPPTAIFSDDEPPLAVALEDLGLGLSAGLDGRATRVFRVGVTGRVGVGVEVDAEAIAPVLYLDPTTFTFRETYNELLPEGFSDGLPALMDTVLGMFLPDDLLSPFALPDLMGLGIGATFWVPTEDDAWQGLYVLLDTSRVEPVEVTGCQGSSLGCGEGEDTGGGISVDLGCLDEGGGCGGGCEDGGACSTGGPVRVSGSVLGRLGLLLALGLLAGLRRREG